MSAPGGSFQFWPVLDQLCQSVEVLTAALCSIGTSGDTIPVLVFLWQASDQERSVREAHQDSKRAARDDHDEETAPGVVSITELSTSCLRSWSRGVDPPACCNHNAVAEQGIIAWLDSTGGRDSIPSPKRGCSFRKGKYLRRRDTHELPGFSVFAVVQEGTFKKSERGNSGW